MKTRIVILCAGKGKRMGADMPKPLVEVSGQPMVLHLLESIEVSGIDKKPILVVSPEGLPHFGNICEHMECEYAVQEEQLGTGHAVLSARELVGGTKNVIVLYGDHPFITSEILEQLLELRMAHAAPVAMLTTKVPNFNKDYEQFLHWGRIIRSKAGSVIATREYKDATEEERGIHEVNPGIYSFDAQWLWDHLADLENKNASGEYYLTDLIEMAIAEGSGVVTASVANPFEVMGINSPEELERAERIMG